MASSSSSSHDIPVSNSQSWKYDVFLSFRGEDTRKGFVDHLYAALEREGIHTFKDDVTLDPGQPIAPTLLKAIQESHIALIVFSENYANSSWCLDELEHIIDCMDKRGQIVMPVFYYVDPSDVRKQNGKFGEAFDKHEQQNKHKLESWGKALLKAGNLSGWVPMNFANGHEAECIKDIVGAISGRLSRLFTEVDKNLVGIEARLLDLKSKLEIGSGGVRMVGIWGVGGGGKTTLASAAYMEFSHQFEAHCLLQDIRESSKNGLEGLQKKFLEAVWKKDVKVGSEIDGKIMIKKRLRQTSVLLVLDDVDDLKQLEALAGSNDWFGKGTRIIITTRYGHLLSRKADAVYEVNLLSRDEAIKLFRRRAYWESNPVENYERLSLDVVSYASGLPLALKILGDFLYDKNKDEWLSVLDKLKSIPNQEVTQILKISYDGLEPDEKALFLDIACLLRGWNKDKAMMVLNAFSFHPVIGVKVLAQKSLVKVSNGIIELHDLVVEMARYIVRGEHPNDPEKHSRIWQKEDIVNLCDTRGETLTENNDVEVVYVSSDVSHPHIPNVVANLKKLRWLCLEGYPASSLPANFQPTNLGYLMLRWGKQNQLWQGCKVLPKLKILDLSSSRYITSTPDFNGLPCLERLILDSCESLEEIHPSIGYLEKLSFVKISGCTRLKTFPPIIRMKKLESFELSTCYRFQEFPDIKTNMHSLVNLRLDNTKIDTVPLSVGQFCTNLVSINLSLNIKLKRIEGNFRLLKRLKKLNLSSCHKLEKLPWDFFDKECCLDVLSLSIKRRDISFDNLMNRLGSQSIHQYSSVSLMLPQFPRFIRKLNLRDCNLGDGDIPSDISELLNLEVLDLTGNKFSRLHSSLSRIPCLKFLNLNWCNKLVELPDLPSSITVLEANNCNSLESLGDLSNYKWLWKVSLQLHNRMIGGVRELHSILQVNAFEDRFMSVTLPNGSGETSPESIVQFRHSESVTRTFTLQLPHNWYSDFNGFLLCAERYQWSAKCNIVIKEVTPSMDSQPDHDHWEEFDKDHVFEEYSQVGYVPFASLSDAPWWNSTITSISVRIKAKGNFKVRLVPRKNKSDDSKKRAMDCSENWDNEKEKRKTFETKVKSKTSSVKIVWSHLI